MSASSRPDEPEFDPFRPQKETATENSRETVPPAEVIPASQSSVERIAGVPPLGIRHLLLWMACSAVLITIHRFSQHSLVQSKSEEMLTAYNVRDLLYSICLGPSLVALFIAAGCWRKRVKFPTHPGEWLLLIQGFLTLMLLIPISLRDITGSEVPSLLLGICNGLGGVAYFNVAWKFSMNRIWKSSFFLSSLFRFNLALYNLVFFYLTSQYDAVLIFQERKLFFFLWLLLTFFFFVVSVIPVFLAAALDLKKHIPRSWLHWTGIACVGIYLLLYTASTVYFQILR